MSRTGPTVAAVGLVVLIALAIAAGYVFSGVLTAPTAAQSTDGEVVERTSVCPSMRVAGDIAETVTAFVDPDAPQDAGTIGGAAAGPVPLPDPGQALRLGPVEPGSAVSVTALGEAVGSTSTVREYDDTGEEGRGLALGSCLQARSQWWFVGTSAGPGQLDELLLANPTDSPAVVALDVFGPAGQIDVAGGGGVVVQPGEQSIVRIDSLIPGLSAATVRVSTSGGLVSAALRSSAIDGLIPRGAEYIPAAADPGTTVVVPGIPAGNGSRELVVTAAGRDAAVRLTYLTDDGELEPQGFRRIPVPAGHTVTVDLDDELTGRAAAVVVSSSTPVVAGARATVEARLAPDATGVLNRVPVADYAWTAGQQPIGTDWVLPLSGVAAAPATLMLSAPSGPVTVRATARSASGAIVEQDVDIPGGATASVTVPVTEGAASHIALTRIAGQSPWFAAVVQSGSRDSGPLIAAATGTDPTTWVSIPVARPDPRALVGR